MEAEGKNVERLKDSEFYFSKGTQKEKQKWNALNNTRQVTIVL